MGIGLRSLISSSTVDHENNEKEPHDMLPNYWLAATSLRLAWLLTSPYMLGDMKVCILRHIQLAKALADLSPKTSVTLYLSDIWNFPKPSLKIKAS